MGIFSKKELNSFETVFWRISGMRGSTEYEIVNKGEESEFTEYMMRCAKGGGMERVPERSVTCKTERILEILNSCEVASWDGFHGKHPKGVRDGIMFRFELVVGGDEKITAEGSENFPKHFREFRDAMRELLNS